MSDACTAANRSTIALMRRVATLRGPVTVQTVADIYRANRGPGGCQSIEVLDVLVLYGHRSQVREFVCSDPGALETANAIGHEVVCADLERPPVAYVIATLKGGRTCVDWEWLWAIHDKYPRDQFYPVMRAFVEETDSHETLAGGTCAPTCCLSRAVLFLRLCPRDAVEYQTKLIRAFASLVERKNATHGISVHATIDLILDEVDTISHRVARPLLHVCYGDQLTRVLRLLGWSRHVEVTLLSEIGATKRGPLRDLPGKLIAISRAGPEARAFVETALENCEPLECAIVARVTGLVPKDPTGPSSDCRLLAGILAGRPVDLSGHRRDPNAPANVLSEFGRIFAAAILGGDKYKEILGLGELIDPSETGYFFNRTPPYGMAIPARQVLEATAHMRPATAEWYTHHVLWAMARNGEATDAAAIVAERVTDVRWFSGTNGLSLRGPFLRQCFAAGAETRTFADKIVASRPLRQLASAPEQQVVPSEYAVRDSMFARPSPHAVPYRQLATEAGYKATKEVVKKRLMTGPSDLSGCDKELADMVRELVHEAPEIWEKAWPGRVICDSEGLRMPVHPAYHKLAEDGLMPYQMRRAAVEGGLEQQAKRRRLDTADSAVASLVGQFV